MQVSLIITVLGKDHPGLVQSLSETLNQFQASWSESRMAHLAGKFAGILQVSVPHTQVDKLTDALHNLQKNDYRILVEKSSDDSHQAPAKTLHVELLAQDRQGIIRDITEQLATLGVNIEELDTHIKEASMSGGMLFCAELTLGLPANIEVDTVEDKLEEMSDQFMIDIKIPS